METGLLTLNDPQTADVQLVGAKAAGLWEVGRQPGVLVPDGVVVLPTAAARSAAARIVDHLGMGPLVVRSSAPGEDDPVSSNAGRFATVLDVVGTAAATQAIEHVRRSGPSAAPIPVLVMPQLVVEAAGVASSVDPVTGDDGVVVEAVPGRGDELLAGRRQPERWKVTTADGPIRLGGPDALGEPQVAEVADLVVRIAGARGQAQEIEWAYADGTLHLLQARPLTALPCRPAVTMPPPGETWQRLDESCGRPLRELEFSAWAGRAEAATAQAFEAVGAPLDRTAFRRIGGWVYSRMVPLGDKGRDGQAPPGPVATGLALRLVPSLRARLRTAAHVWVTDPGKHMVAAWERDGRSAMRRRTRHLRDVERSGLDDEQLAGHVENVLDHVGRAWGVHARLPVFSTYLALGRLGALCERLLGWGHQRTLQLVAGHTQRSVERARDLAALSAAIRRDPNACRLLDHAPDRLTTEDSAAGDRLRRFLDVHGHQIVGTDLAHPTWAEDPTPVLMLLRAHVNSEHRPTADPTAQADAAEREATRILTARPGQLAEFGHALAAARSAQPYADDTERDVLEALGVVRYAALEAGRRLAARTLLPDADGVFHLHDNELLDAIRGGPIEADIAQRRAEHRWALSHPGPRRYGPAPTGESPELRWAPGRVRDYLAAVAWVTTNLQPAPGPPTENGDALRGTPASAGIATGPVRVVREPADFPRIVTGDILVCPSTLASWSVVFPLVAAVVTEVGGPLSHPAVLARESGLPAVLGVERATERLIDGTVVRVDGTTGTVTRVEDSPRP